MVSFTHVKGLRKPMALKDIQTKKGLYVQYRDIEGEKRDGFIDEVYQDGGVEKVNIKLGPLPGSNREKRAHGVIRDDQGRKNDSWRPAKQKA